MLAYIQSYPTQDFRILTKNDGSEVVPQILCLDKRAIADGSHPSVICAGEGHVLY